MRREPGDGGATERDPATVGAVKAGEDIEQRRLAGAVRADQAGDGAFADFERAPVDRADAAE
jgi:hypothetical protein